MQKYFHILVVLLISLSIFSCSHFSESEKMLEKRANYNQQDKSQKKITRTKGNVKKAWLHAHEMPTGDYFGGAWVYLLVEETKWNINGN